MVKALEAVAVTVIEPPKLTDDPLIVIEEFVSALLATPLNVPPKVRLPEVVTLPVRVNPLTVPVPLTEVTEPDPLPLKVFQSVDVKYPLTDVVAAGMLMTGVVPPVDTTGAVAVTLVTVPPELDELIVWFGQVPVMVMLDPATREGVVVPVPPLTTFKTPAKVIEPAVGELGVKPVVPALKSVTPPAVPLDAAVSLPYASTVSVAKE